MAQQGLIGALQEMKVYFATDGEVWIAKNPISEEGLGIKVAAETRFVELQKLLVNFLGNHDLMQAAAEGCPVRLV